MALPGVNGRLFGPAVSDECTRLVHTSAQHVARSRVQMEGTRIHLAETQLKIVESQKTLARFDRLIRALRREMEF